MSTDKTAKYLGIFVRDFVVLLCCAVFVLTKQHLAPVSKRISAKTR